MKLRLIRLCCGSKSVSFFFIALFFLILFSSPALAQQVRVGIYDNPPKVFLTENGVAAGLYPDILNAISRERGWQITYVPGTWQQCLDRLKNGKTDLLVDIAKTEERQSAFAFGREPVLTNWGTVYTRKGSVVRTFKELKGKSIALVRGSVHTEGQGGFKQIMQMYNIPFTPVEVGSYPEAMMLLDSAQVEACVVNRLFGALYADAYEVEATPLILSPKVLFFAGRKGDNDTLRILRQIDESLHRLKKNPDSVFHQAMGYYLSGGREKWEQIQAGYIQALDMSPEEQQWVREHPVVKFSIDENFPPFEFTLKNGKVSGMAADYLSLISQKTGLQFQRIGHDSWSQTIDAAKAGQIDLLPCLVNTAERRSFLSFTDPYIQFSRVIITALNSPVGRQNGMDNLERFRVGVQDKSSHHDFIKTKTRVSPVLYPTFQAAVIALSKGKIDAVVGNLAVASHVIKTLSLTNLKFSGYADPEPQKLSMGVRADRPELTRILNRALASITFREKNRILSRWFPLPTEAHTHIGLTREEREWLLLNPVIKVGWDRHWAPLEFADENGVPKGISMEYLAAMEKMLGIKFEMGHDYGWKNTESMIASKQIDMSACLAITPKRLGYLEFTSAYLSLPVVIFARDDMPYVRDMTELSDKRVGLVEGYAVDQWVSADHPDFNLIRTATVNQGLELLAKKKVDVFLCNVLPGNYYLSRIRRHDIKIVGETPYKFKLRMAVRKDWPLFARIIQKTLKALPEADKTYFYRKWAQVKYEKGFDYALFTKIMAGVLILVCLIITWNRSLAAEISRRKKAEAGLAEQEARLRQKNKDLEQMESLKDNLAHMIVHDMRSPLTGIGSAIDMVELKLDPLQLSPKVHKYLLMAHNGVDTLMRMIQSMLDVFKLESNELNLHPEYQDMKALAEKIVEDMQGQATMYGIPLVLSGQPSMGAFDAEIIRRVLANLIENAFKASQKGQTVSVRIQTVQDDILVEVRDNGYGIPAAFQEKIFDKFCKVETKEANLVSSYGLGLAFCKLAVEAHKGSIQVQSIEGEGSTFSFTLPKSFTETTR